MELYYLVTFVIISMWLICMSFILYNMLTTDNTGKYIIYNKTQLIKYVLFILGIIALIVYLFFIRMNNIGKVINIFNLWNNVLEKINPISWSMLIMLLMIGILGLIFVFLLSSVLYKYINMILLALYVYFYQYEFFCDKLVGGQIDLRCDFNHYLVNRVMFFTENLTCFGIAYSIWPLSFYWLEPRIFKLLIPYLIMFDLITQDGTISKVFNVFPWYFLYMLIRTAWIKFHDFFKPENINFSRTIYKTYLINGKIHRMAIIANPEETGRNKV